MCKHYIEQHFKGKVYDANAIKQNRNEFNADGTIPGIG